MNEASPPSGNSCALSASSVVLLSESLADYRAEILSKLAKLALLKAGLKQVLAPFETQIAALQKACHDATRDEVREIEILEADIKTLAAEHPDEVFGEARTIRQNQLSLGARRADKVELDGSEDDVISALERLCKGQDAAVAMYAAACLRKTTELNRVFIREQWGDERACEFFGALGISVRESVSVSISEIKPPKAKVTKDKVKGKAVEGAES